MNRFYAGLVLAGAALCAPLSVVAQTEPVKGLASGSYV